MSYLDVISKLFDELPKNEDEYRKILLQTLRKLNGAINLEDESLKLNLKEITANAIKTKAVFQFVQRLLLAQQTYLESEIKLRQKYKVHIWNEDEERYFRELRERNPIQYTHKRGLSAREKKQKDLMQRMMDLGYNEIDAKRIAEDNL